LHKANVFTKKAILNGKAKIPDKSAVNGFKKLKSPD